MDKHHSNSLRLAKYLSAHPCVSGVVHPLLPSHPSHQLAMAQHEGKHSGVFSFYVKGSKVQAEKFLSGVKLVGAAVSLGGVHTTVTLPANTTHSFLTPEEKTTTGITDNLVRMSVGLEDAKDIERDLDRALRAATSEQ